MPRYDEKRWKPVIVDYAIAETHETDDMSFILSRKEAFVLLSIVQPQHWKTRWKNLTISQDDLDQMIGEIEHRLMTPEDILIDCNEVEACLSTSPIIIALQNAVNANTADIATNTADIITTNALAQLAYDWTQVNNSRLLANDGDITALQNVDNVHTAQLALHGNLIQLNFDWTQVNSTRISNNDTDILALQNVDNSLQSQITANANAVTVLTGSVANHDLLIEALYACTDCEWTANLDFAVSDYDSFVGVTVGEYSVDHYKSTGQPFSQVKILINSVEDYTITGITVYYYVDSFEQQGSVIYVSSGSPIWSVAYNVTNFDSDNFVYMAISPEETVEDELTVIVQHSTQSNIDDGARLYQVKVHGKGIVPDELKALLEV